MWRGIVVSALVGWALLLGFARESVAAVAVERGDMLNVLQSVQAGPNVSGSDLYAFAGSPAAGFSEPQVISEPGDSIAVPASGLAEPQLVAGPAGNLLAAWNAARLYQAFSDQYPYTETFSRGVWYAWRPAGARSFQPPRQLLPPGPVSLIRLVMNDRGEAVATYNEGTSIYIRRFTSGGTFGSPELVATESATEDPAVLLGIDLTESGELVAVTETKHLVQARFAAPGQGLGAPQTLTTEAQPDWLAHPSVMAGDARGDAVVLLLQDEELQADYRVAGQAFGKLQPLTATQSEAIQTIPRSIAIDAQGRATVAMEVWHSREAATPGELEVSESNTTGVFPSPTDIESFPRVPGVELMAGVGNETALFTYAEEAASNQPSSNKSFATRMRLSSEGSAFGAPEIVETGMTGWQPGCGYREHVGTAGASWLTPRFPAFAPDETGGFYALQAFHEVICPLESKLQRYLVQIQSLGTEGIGKPIDIQLTSQPLFAITPTISPQPTTVIYIGQAQKLRVDRDGYVQGKLACGASIGHSCHITIVLTAPDGPLHTLPESHIALKAFARATLRIRLDRQARSELNSGRRLASTLTISTLGEGAPPTTSEYPLTILPPSERQPHHKRHPKMHHRRRSTRRR